MYIPLCIGISSQSLADRIDFLPPFAPLMCISFLRNHVDDFQIVAPAPNIFSLIFQTIPFDSPFTGAFPFHDTSADIRAHDHDNLLTPTYRGTAV